MKAEKKYPELTNEKVYCFEDIDLSLTYSYSNYLNWLFDERVELIKGKVSEMSPAPSRVHQEVSGAIFLALGNFLKNNPCKVYAAPFDVRFPKESKAEAAIYTVLQPDICVVCEQSKLDAHGCIGTPELIIEILSPGNNKKELFDKYKIYEEFGVKEYWIVSYTERTVLVYTLDDIGKFQPSKLFSLNEEVSSSVLSGFVLPLDSIFEDID